uniref:Venom peptide isomerase light chain n=1 Tax=Agelenopsis aperta TaxID=6908 RepID=ISOLC_AGEAP|nr:RecName: Full=Venom peptide isomerase light chain [Agelenopsis aperta]AAB34913.1 peptide isomerase light chain [Agelenopsis aperta]
VEVATVKNCGKKLLATPR